MSFSVREDLLALFCRRRFFGFVYFGLVSFLVCPLAPPRPPAVLFCSNDDALSLACPSTFMSLVPCSHSFNDEIDFVGCSWLVSDKPTFFFLLTRDDYCAESGGVASLGCL